MPGGDHCCVPQCTSDQHEESLVLFHTLPKGKLLYGKEVDSRNQVRCQAQILRDTCVCSEHFTNDHYCQGLKAESACLKKDAVPNVFAWMADDDDTTMCDRTIRAPSTCSFFRANSRYLSSKLLTSTEAGKCGCDV